MFTLPPSARGVVRHATGRTLSASRLDLSTAVDRNSGRVIATNHAAFGETLAQRALVLAVDGDADGPTAQAEAVTAVLLDLVEFEMAPALIVLDRPDPSVVLAALVADALLERGPALLVLDPLHFALATSSHTLTLEADARLILTGPQLAGLANVTGGGALAFESATREAANDAVTLSPRDRERLDGEKGAGVRAATGVLMRLAVLYEADRVADVLGVHVGASELGAGTSGPGTRGALTRLAAVNASLAVPTTFEEGMAEANRAALVALGARPEEPASPGSGTWLRHNASAGVGWQRVPGWLGLCAAITGRIPVIGPALGPGDESAR